MVLFPELDLEEISVVFKPGDGPGGTLAHTNLYLKRPSKKVYVDTYDTEGKGTINFRNPWFRALMCHELVHVDQTHRGEEFRADMLWALYNLPYEMHPHEWEANSLMEIVYGEWPCLH